MGAAGLGKHGQKGAGQKIDTPNVGVEDAPESLRVCAHVACRQSLRAFFSLGGLALSILRSEAGVVHQQVQMWLFGLKKLNFLSHVVLVGVVQLEGNEGTARVRESFRGAMGFGCVLEDIKSS